MIAAFELTMRSNGYGNMMDALLMITKPAAPNFSWLFFIRWIKLMSKIVTSSSRLSAGKSVFRRLPPGIRVNFD